MAGLIGALRVSLSADTAAFQQGMTKAQRQAAQSSTAIQKSLSGIKAGLTGLAAGVTLGAMTAIAKRALDYASSLGEVSKQLGVTSRDLQTFRYIASQVGISQEAMDKGLAKLTLGMDKAQQGSKPAIAAFKAIGLTLDDIRGKTAGDLLPKMADGFNKIGGAGKNAATGVTLMGKNFQQFVPLFDEGSKGISGLADAAERMGLVLSDSQIQAADETADKLAALKQVLEARIAGVVADNAGSILDLANSFSNLAVGIARFMAQDPGKAFAILGALAGLSIGGRFGPIGAAAGAAIGAGIGFANAPDTVAAQREKVRQQRARLQKVRNAKAYPAQQYDLRQGAGSLQRETAKLLEMSTVGSVAFSSADGAGADPAGLLGGGGGKKRGGKTAEQLANEAERIRKDQLRDAYQFASDERRNQIDIIQAQMDLTEDYSDRSTLATQILDLERDQEQAALAQAVALGDLTQARADELAVQQEKLDALKRDKLVLDEQYDRRREVLQIDETVLDIERDKLDGQSRLAETAAEQRAVELRILDLAYRQERARLEAVMADERASYGDKESARLRLGSLGDRMAADRAGVIRGTMGPMEAFLDSLPDTAAKANEAFEALAANGLSSLIDGIAEAGFNIKKLGDVFSNVAKQIIADLIRIQLQKAIVGALSGALGGLFGGNPSKGFSSALPSFDTSSFNFSGGRALGGPVLPGRTYRVGERGPEFLTMGAKGHVTPDNDNSGRIAHIVPSPYFDVVVDGRAQRVAAPMAGRAAVAGSAGAQSAINRRNQRRIP